MLNFVKSFTSSGVDRNHVVHHNICVDSDSDAVTACDHVAEIVKLKISESNKRQN